jgi:hypothetical protein
MPHPITPASRKLYSHNRILRKRKSGNMRILIVDDSSNYVEKVRRPATVEDTARASTPHAVSLVSHKPCSGPRETIPTLTRHAN